MVCQGILRKILNEAGVVEMLRTVFSTLRTFSSFSNSTSSMSAKLYIGNLAWKTSTESLKSAFSAYGNVEDAIVMTDRETGRSRGFGFVTFSSEQEAQAAINEMSGKDLDGRNIRVDLAAARDGNRDSGSSAGGFRSQGNYRREY